MNPQSFRYATDESARILSSRGGSACAGTGCIPASETSGAQRQSSAAVRYPAAVWARNRRPPSSALPSRACPTVRITKDGLEQTQAGSRASACRGVSCPLRTACEAAEAAGANPPRNPMQSTRAAQGARMPINRAADRNGRDRISAPGHCIRSLDTTRNGNSDSKSGPPQRDRPSRSACPQASGARNGRIPVARARKNSAVSRSFPC